MENLQKFFTWSHIRQTLWKLMREHDECCKLSNPSESVYILKCSKKKKKCFWEASRDSPWRISWQGRYQRIKLQEILPSLLDEQKNCFALVNLYNLE